MNPVPGLSEPVRSRPRASRPGRSSRSGPGNVSVYDFRRPIQLSREHARILQVGFDGFARQATNVFTSALRTVCQVSLVSVEQYIYNEYVDSLLAPTYMTIFTADPIPGRGTLEMPVRAVMTCIDRILGGPGSAVQPLRNLTEIETSVVAGLVARLLSEMRYSLGNVVDFQPTTVGVEYSPMFAQLVGASDVVAVATLELRIDEKPSRMTVCLPFAGLLPHLVAAAAPAPVSDRERANRDAASSKLHRQFEQVPVDVHVRFRGTRVFPGSLDQLQVGDVVRLNHPAGAPLEVSTADSTFAHATPGAKGTTLAALIVGAPQEDR